MNSVKSPSQPQALRKDTSSASEIKHAWITELLPHFNLNSWFHVYTEPFFKKKKTKRQELREAGGMRCGRHEVLKAIIYQMSLRYLQEAFSIKGVEMGAPNRERRKWDGYQREENSYMNMTKASAKYESRSKIYVTWVEPRF